MPHDVEFVGERSIVLHVGHAFARLGRCPADARHREVERRGITEVGIYRVSGSAADVARLRRAFESNPYEAEQLLKDCDIHSVAGIPKMYLRERNPSTS